jgi:hypothetical protein
VCEPLPEICNGLDDDCDEVVDNDCQCVPEVCDGVDNDCNADTDDIPADPCPTGGFGRCAPGRRACLDGEEICMPDNGPIPEVCNLEDDDCDGTVDNGLECPRPGESCPQAEVITPGTYALNLLNYLDDAPTCAPGDVDRWFRIDVPAGPSRFIDVRFTGGGALPDAWELRDGPCGDQGPSFCGLIPPSNPPLRPPGTYFIVVEGRNLPDTFNMIVNLNVP